MKVHVLLAVLAASAAACGPTVAAMPTTTVAPAEADLVLVWVGRGEAHRWRDGAWHRDAAYDYEFSVVQRRYPDRWESIKSMHRRHPDYDGKAGPRDQSYFFRIDLAPAPDGVRLAIDSNLGTGAGHTDREFREATLDLASAQRGAFVPYDRLRLTQHYGYQAGKLDETVELTDEGAPFMKNEEHAVLFGTQQFEGAPTQYALGER